MQAWFIATFVIGRVVFDWGLRNAIRNYHGEREQGSHSVGSHNSLLLFGFCRNGSPFICTEMYHQLDGMGRLFHSCGSGKSMVGLSNATKMSLLTTQHDRYLIQCTSHSLLQVYTMALDKDIASFRKRTFWWLSRLVDGGPPSFPNYVITTQTVLVFLRVGLCHDYDNTQNWHWKWAGSSDVFVIVVLISSLVFYLRIMVERWQKLVVQVVTATVVVFGISYFACVVAQCVPVPHIWNRFSTTMESQGGCLPEGIVLGGTYLHSIISAGSDWILAFMPVAMLWHVKLGKSIRTLVWFILLLGALWAAFSFIPDYRDADVVPTEPVQLRLSE